MNGFAALDIPPCRRYVVVKATAGFAVCRLILKLLLFYSCLDFTQNLGKTHSVAKIVLIAGLLIHEDVFLWDLQFSQCNQLPVLVLVTGADPDIAI